MSADYLFMPDKLYDVQYDTGDKVIQCGRHNDIFKLWLQWRSKVTRFFISCYYSNNILISESLIFLFFFKGTDGFDELMDHLMGLMEYQVERMRQMPDKFYIIIPEPECVNVSFWYIPKRLRGVPHTPEREKILGQVNSYTF
jgi:glutamate decarboxylase